MDYLGPSRAQSRASANAWSELGEAELKKIHGDQPECKRVVECMKRAGPTLETAAHRILVADWRRMIWQRVQAISIFILLLFLVGGYALAYRVATAGSYSKAAGAVYSGVLGRASAITSTPSFADPGVPSWLNPN